MDTALPQKFLFILDRNLAKANCRENRVFTSCDTAVLDYDINIIFVDFVFYCQNSTHSDKTYTCMTTQVMNSFSEHNMMYLLKCPINGLTIAFSVAAEWLSLG